MNRRDFIVVCGGVALTGGAPIALSSPKDWPNKAVRVIVPFPAGGATDIIARVLAQKFTQLFGQSFVVENRAGASGLIGQTAAARAEPDGYTLLLTGNGPHAVNPGLFEPMPYDPVKDFAQISLTSVLPLVLNVHPSVSAKTLAEFVSWVRANPGKLHYASPGIGSPPHLTMELFKSQNGLDIVHVPYKGSSVAITDLIGGQVSVMFDNALASHQYIKSGKINSLGVGSAARLESLPQVPTFKEAGFPDFEAYTWTALVAPVGTPEDIVRRLSEAAADVLADPEVQKSLAAQGAIAVSSTPTELKSKVQAEMRKWSNVIELAKIPKVQL